MFLGFLPKLARTPVVVGILIALSQITHADVLVQHDTASGFTSTGYYNEKIGTTLDGTDPFFPPYRGTDSRIQNPQYRMRIRAK